MPNKVCPVALRKRREWMSALVDRSPESSRSAFHQEQTLKLYSRSSLVRSYAFGI